MAAEVKLVSAFNMNQGRQLQLRCVKREYFVVD